MSNNSTDIYWYEVNPSRLEMEKMAMGTLFPEFTLLTLNNGALRWSGVLKSERFKRSTGYNVTVDYYDCGSDMPGKFRMVITPTVPDFKTLFIEDCEPIKELLLDQIAIDMKCIGYANPDEDSATIKTAASQLKKAVDWFVRYEVEKERLEQERQKADDAAARKRQELRELLKAGIKVRLLKSGNNQGECMVYNLFKRCQCYLELLPNAEHPQKILRDSRVGFSHRLTSCNTIPPYVIIDSFDDLIERASMKDLQLIYNSNRNSFSYYFDIQALRIRPNIWALMFAYFLQNAGLFCFPSEGINRMYQRKLIFSKEDLINELKKVKLENTISDIDKLPKGIDDFNIPFGFSGIGTAPQSFTYYYWNDIKGYIKCYIKIYRKKVDEYINISDIEFIESQKILIPLCECQEN